MKPYARIEQAGGQLHAVLEPWREGRAVLEIGAFGNQIAGLILSRDEGETLRAGLERWLGQKKPATRRAAS